MPGRAGCRCGLRLDDADGAVVVQEDLVGHAPDVGFGHLVYTVEVSEQLAPIAVARLVDGELLRQPFIAGQAAEQIRLGARLEHLQLFVGYVLRLQLFDLLLNALAAIPRRMSGSGTA